MALDEVIQSVCEGITDAVSSAERSAALAMVQGGGVANKRSRADVPATAVQLVVVGGRCCHLDSSCGGDGECCEMELLRGGSGLNSPWGLKATKEQGAVPADSA